MHLSTFKIVVAIVGAFSVMGGVTIIPTALYAYVQVFASIKAVCSHRTASRFYGTRYAAISEIRPRSSVAIFNFVIAPKAGNKTCWTIPGILRFPIAIAFSFAGQGLSGATRYRGGAIGLSF